MKAQMQKQKLFNKLKTKGIFWSFAKDITLEQVGDKIFLEYLLKYGDFDDLILTFRLYDKEYTKSVWEEKLKSDKSFIKLNLMLARVFFGMDVESSYFKEVKNARAEKFKMFASQHSKTFAKVARWVSIFARLCYGRWFCFGNASLSSKK